MGDQWRFPPGLCPAASCYSLDSTGRVQPQRQPDFTGRTTLCHWKMPTAHPGGSNKLRACRSLLQKTHYPYNLFGASSWIQFSVILFFFLFPNNQPHKKSWFHMYNHFKSMLLSEHSHVIYHHFSAILKECY